MKLLYLAALLQLPLLGLAAPAVPALTDLDTDLENQDYQDYVLRITEVFEQPNSTITVTGDLVILVAVGACSVLPMVIIIEESVVIIMQRRIMKRLIMMRIFEGLVGGSLGMGMGFVGLL
ncbi:uncharacterized protein LDX57_004969 [Aspergillus melleus]|uniref:uncharacterized protein n=1 Tax=Aspergillus melleus TaxID=138277 RepID=UPI001E8D96DF|nr:uncharacterized protein LDX57_004969 [Aspergillus melleus]KAH8427256.1 hypothetical protein LDX57_004969 [Aspergillus melleus]